MDSLKTTVTLLFLLALSLSWNLRPVPGAASLPVPASVESSMMDEALAREETAVSHPRKVRRREASVFHLQTVKSLEEQRLYDLKLYHLFRANKFEGFMVTGMNEKDLQRYTGSSNLEKLAAAREEAFERNHKNFLMLEDFILDTEFTELTEVEKEVVYRYYGLRKRADEAKMVYYETPMEEWVDLALQCQSLRDEVCVLLERQYRHDTGGMSVVDALRGFLPVLGLIDTTFPCPPEDYIRVLGALPFTSDPFPVDTTQSDRFPAEL